MNERAPVAFFDRDGVVNVSPGPGYVLTPDEFHLTPGIGGVLNLCRRHGFRLILVTSQQGVGKGLMTEEDLRAIHDKMQRLLAAEDAAFDAIHTCAHLAGRCECRKPSPKMILDAAREGNLDLSRALMIGDHDRDIQMARNAGLPVAIRLAGEKEIREPADFTVRTVEEMRETLERVLPELKARVPG